MKLITKINRGENRFLEFKSDLPQKMQIAKTAVAFANGAGGELCLGVDDDKKIIGLTDEQLNSYPDKIVDIIHGNCIPFILPDVYKSTIYNKTILVVKIYPGSSKPYFIKKLGEVNGTFIRVGATNKLADHSVFKQFERERNNISYDEEINYNHSINDFNFVQLTSDFKNLVEKDLIEKDFENFKLIKKENNRKYLTNASVFLGGLVDRAKVKCARFKGVNMDEFIDKKEFSGMLYSVVNDVMGFIKNHLFLHGKIENIQRIDTYEIPIIALREAVINAIIHRDYSIESDVKIAIYDDMVEIISPGVLPRTITIEEIESGRSEIRNRLLTRIFRELNLIEEWGSGIQKMKRLCIDAGLDPPVFIEKSGYFAVEFYKNVENSATESATTTENIRDSATYSATYSATRKKKIMAFLLEHQKITNKDIQQLFNVKNAMARRILKYLTDEKWLIKSGSGKSTAYIKSTEIVQYSSATESATTTENIRDSATFTATESATLSATRKVQIMAFLLEHKQITNKDIQQLFQVKDAMARRILKKMVDSNILLKKGRGKNTYYENL